MPAVQGQNNFSGYQKQRVQFLKDQIDKHLKVLSDSRVRFDTTNALAKYIRELLTEDLVTKWAEENEARLLDGRLPLKKPKPIAISTFSRNLEYRKKLRDFINNQCIKRGTDSDLEKTKHPLAEAKLLELKLECSNLRAEVQTLRKYIENSGIQCNENTSDVKQLNQVPDHSETTNDFVQTARALALVLEESEDMLLIQDNQLITQTRMTNQVVVNQATLSPFLKWFKDQEACFER